MIVHDAPESVACGACNVMTTHQSPAGCVIFPIVELPLCVAH